MVELGETLSANVQDLRSKLFPARRAKEPAPLHLRGGGQLIGVSDAYLRQMALDGKGPTCRPPRPAAGSTPCGRSTKFAAFSMSAAAQGAMCGKGARARSCR